MMLNRRQLLEAAAAALAASPYRIFGAQPPADDWRNIETGSEIPREGYSDQPYVVKTREGHWLCVLTTGRGVEGESGQHIISTISTDRGKTWSAPVDIEPASGPEASWVMPLATPGGRVYAFYSYNADNLRLDTKSNNPRSAKRVDTLGKYAFKYSDDGGRSWSKDRYFIPVRLMRLDRENAHEGKLLYFWGVGKPITTRTGAMFGFAKVGKWGDPGTMVTSQGVFMKSSNILTEKDPARLHWETLPAGEEGLRAPKGPVSDEANLVELNDGSLYATYRTIDGYNCAAYSRDGGKTWTPPAYATYTPQGRRIKHPRAANFVKKFSNGKYLLWFHNQGGEVVHAPGKWQYYTGRNPAWVTGGAEKNGFIHWSQPEILLYHPDPNIRTSYPDFIEDGGEYYVTETIKTFARVHHIDKTLLDGMWNQDAGRSVAQRGLSLTLSGDAAGPGTTVTLPALTGLSQGGGFSLEFWLKLYELSPGQTLFETRGISVRTSDRFTLALTLTDGNQREFTWDSDPGTHEGTLKVGVWQHVVFIVDGASRVVSVVVDGVLNDGGAVRQYGWGRFEASLGDLTTGPQEAKLAPAIFGQVETMRVYNRYLRTAEAVANFRAGRG